MTTRYSFLLFHAISEFFSIAVAFSIFLIAWNARKFAADNYLLFIGFSCFFVGALDLLHTLAYKGMMVFNNNNDSNLATQLWIAARFLQAGSFFAAPFFINRKMNWQVVLSAFVIVTLTIIGSIFVWKIFPVCFIEGYGLTTFKKVAEYFICILFVASIFLLYLNKASFNKSTANIIIASLLLTIFSELLFTGYITVSGAINVAGHFFKIAAFFLLYRVLVQSQITNPLETMFRDIKKHEMLLTKALNAAKIRTVEVTSLLDITTNILVSQSFEESANNILSRSIELTNAACGYVVVCEPDSDNACRVVTEQGTSLFISQSSFLKFFTDRYLNDLAGDGIFCGNGINVSIVNGTISNIVSSPLIADGHMYGWIVLLNKATDFTRNDMRMLSSFSELCSIALQSFEATRLLKESEQRFELFMNNLPACAYIKDSRGKYLFANKCFEDTFCSYDVDNHKMVMDEMSEDKAEKIKREDNFVVSTGKILEENLVLTSKGVDKTFMIKKFPIKGDVGTMLIGSIAIDITEKHEYEENLRREREKLENILNTMENGVVIVSRDYEIKYVNPAMSRAFGKVDGKKCYEYLSGLDQPCKWCDFTPVIGGQSVHSEYNNAVTNRIYDSVDAPYVDTVTGQMCKLKMLWDITEVKQAQEKIRSLALFPSENPYPVLRISTTGEIIYSNKPGYDVLEKWGTSIGQKVPSDFFELIKKATQSNKYVITEEEIRDRVLSLTITPLVGENYVNIYGRDITDYKNAERELIRANDELEQRVKLRTKQLSDTVDTLQEEVRDRLAAESNLLDNQKRLRSLSQELALAEERQRRKFAVELHDSIGQLLAFSKKELGLMLDKGPEDMQAKVKKVWQSIRESIDLTRKLTFDLSSPTLYTLGLESAIEEIAEQLSDEHNYRCVLSCCILPDNINEDIQIFIFRSIRELLLNVAKHAEAQNVKIIITSNDRKIKVVVEDDGVGFDVEGFNNSRTAIKSYGLFSVRESLNNFGGKLQIEAAEDKGTRVVMHIPLTEHERY